MGSADGAAGQVGVVVFLGLPQLFPKAVNVQYDVGRIVQLQALARNVQVGGIGVIVADGFAEVDQGLIKVAAGGRFGVFGPEQRGQLFTAVGLLALNGQVGPPGPNNITYFQDSQLRSLAPHTINKYTWSDCPGSDRSINGGFFYLDHDTVPGSFASRFDYKSNGPNANGDGWTTIIINDTDDAGVGYSYMYCAPGVSGFGPEGFDSQEKMGLPTEEITVIPFD